MGYNERCRILHKVRVRVCGGGGEGQRAVFSFPLGYPATVSGITTNLVENGDSHPCLGGYCNQSSRFSSRAANLCHTKQSQHSALSPGLKISIGTDGGMHFLPGHGNGYRKKCLSAAYKIHTSHFAHVCLAWQK